LLKQILEDGNYNPPKYIIGITADIDALHQHDDEFRRLTTSIIEVTPASNWKESLRISINHEQTARANSTYDYDVCVLTALADPELKAVLSVWKPIILSEEFLTCGVIAKLGTITCGVNQKKIVFTHLPQMGLVAATHTTEALLQKFKPRVLIMTGICGGFSDKVNVGDVVVADKSWDWQSGKWADNGILLPAPDSKDASRDLVALVRNIEPKLIQFLSSFQGNTPKTIPKLVIEPMVSGSSVVASTDIQQAFRNQHRKMAAVDMECYGVYYAAYMTTAPSPKVICIKSVSDLADRKKADDLQKYCSYISACVALDLVNTISG
jgi:nucleoside phosphorylase